MKHLKWHILLSLFLLSPLGAFAEEGVKIERILIESQSHIRTQDLIDILPIRAGTVVTDADLLDSVSVLKERGIFSNIDVELRKKDGINEVVFTLHPLYSISEITFRGNTEFSDVELRRIASISAGVLYEEQLLSNAVDRIIRRYEEEGYANTQVSFDVFSQGALPEKRVEFRLYEGERITLKEVKLSGDVPESAKETIATIIEESIGLAASKTNIQELGSLLVLALRRDGYLQAFIETSSFEPNPDTLDARVEYHLTARDPLSIFFKGNTVFNDEEILKLMKLETRKVPFTPNAIPNLRREIISLYQSAGYYFVEVNFQELSPEGNRRRYEINIKEGQPVRLSRVVISSDERIDATALRQAIATKPAGWLLIRPWARGYINDKQLAADAQSMEAFLSTRGYVRAKVTYEVKQIENSSWVEVEFFVVPDEALVLRSVSVQWKGVLGLLEDESTSLIFSKAKLIEESSALKAGEPLDVDRVNQEQVRLVQFLSNNGFPLAEVTPEFNEKNESLLFRVSPGPAIRFGKISFQGNKYTADRSILRTLSFKRGEPWNLEAVTNSERALYSLGAFRSVSIQPADGSFDSPIEDVLVRVVERNTGTFALGVGFNTEDGLNLKGELGQTNVLGRGQGLSLGVDGFIKSGEKVLDAGTARLRHRIPYLRSIGAEVLSEVFSQFEIELFDQYSYDRFGASSSVRKKLFEKISASVGYTLLNEHLYDVVPDAIIGPDDTGTTVYSFVSGAIEWDDRDNPYNPRQGLRTLVESQLASDSIGSEANFLGLRAQQSYFFPIADSIVWANNVRTDYLKPFGDTESIPLGQRLFPVSYTHLTLPTKA